MSAPVVHGTEPFWSCVTAVSQGGLFHVRQHDDQPGETSVRAVNGGVRFKKFLITGVRQILLHVVEVLTSKPELFHVVRALHTTRRFARRLNGWKQQTNQDTDDRDNDQEFNEREPARILFIHPILHLLPVWLLSIWKK